MCRCVVEVHGDIWCPPEPTPTFHLLVISGSLCAVDLGQHHNIFRGRFDFLPINHRYDPPGCGGPPPPPPPTFGRGRRDGRACRGRTGWRWVYISVCAIPLKKKTKIRRKKQN